MKLCRRKKTGKKKTPDSDANEEKRCKVEKDLRVMYQLKQRESQKVF